MRENIWNILSETNAKGFWNNIDDIIMSAAVIVGVINLVLASDSSITLQYGAYLAFVQLAVDVVFVSEFVLRLWSAPERIKYIRSSEFLFDLVVVLPAFAFLIPSLRVLYILALFRCLKLAKYNNQIYRILLTLRRSVTKLLISSLFAFFFILLLGTLMWTFEHTAQPDKFPNIASSTWTSAITLTTIGYGDAYPITPGGKFVTVLSYLWGGGFIIGIPVAILNETYIQTHGEE